MSNTAKRLESVAGNGKERRQRARKAPGFASRKGQPLVEGLTKSELILKYGERVRVIARRIASSLPQSVDPEDLVSVGFMGLMNAADRFDASKGAKFSTYAEFRIRGAILDELRNQDWIPKPVRAKIKKDEATAKKLGPLMLVNYGDLNEDPALEEKMTEHAGGEKATPYTMASRSDAKAWMDRMMADLSENERRVLSMYYYRELNLREIAQILELTESRISQIHSQAIFKLKQLMLEKIPDVKSLFVMLLEAA